jgi:hypothetical protein
VCNAVFDDINNLCNFYFNLGMRIWVKLVLVVCDCDVNKGEEMSKGLEKTLLV